jgi:hypothetical protein
MTQSPQIIVKFYDFLIYLIPHISDFPRNQRFLIGERLELACFDLLELLLDACYSRLKAPILQQANLKLEKIRYYVRLCKDLRLISMHRYEVISKMVNEIGMQLGGWIKQQKTA